jgi:hypothetical protein
MREQGHAPTGEAKESRRDVAAARKRRKRILGKKERWERGKKVMKNKKSEQTATAELPHGAC